MIRTLTFYNILYLYIAMGVYIYIYIYIWVHVLYNNCMYNIIISILNFVLYAYNIIISICILYNVLYKQNNII